MLDTKRLRQLRQRITVRYHLTPLAREEMELYIHWRLQIAGANGRPTFPPWALRRIFGYSKGSPRGQQSGDAPRRLRRGDRPALSARCAAIREPKGLTPPHAQGNVPSGSFASLVDALEKAALRRRRVQGARLPAAPIGPAVLRPARFTRRQRGAAALPRGGGGVRSGRASTNPSLSARL
jgi:hypothetical protein